MRTFSRFLDESVEEIQQDVLDNMLSHSEEALVNFFSSFVSSGRATEAAQIVASGNSLEIKLTPPLNYLMTGTGLYGPHQQEFIVASTNNVLTWEEGGARYFASSVTNPGMHPKFTEDDVLQALTDSYKLEVDW